MDGRIGIVTAFFDIGRGDIGDEFPGYLKRTNSTYLEYFSNLALLENKMVIFTSEEWKDKILEIRKGKPTEIITINLRKKFRKQLSVIGEIQKNRKFIEKVNKDMLVNIEYWSPEYVLITNLKAYFVNYAVKRKMLTENLVSWVDFGYVREKGTLNNVKYWKYPFDEKKIHFFTIRKKYPLKKIEDVHNAIFNNAVFIIGGAVVGGQEKWREFYRLLRDSQNELLKQDIVDDDQGLYMMSIFKRPEMFRLNYLGKDNWFGLFTEYGEASEKNVLKKISKIFKL